MTDLFHNPGNAGNGSFDVSIGSTGPVPQPKGRGRVRGEDFGLPGRDSLTDLAATYLDLQARLWPELVGTPPMSVSMAVRDRRLRLGARICSSGK